MRDIPRFEIFVDMDDTIVDFMGGFAKAFGKPWDEAKDSINFDPPWGWSWLQERAPTFWQDLKPLKGALTFWKNLTNIQEKVNLLTAYPTIWNNVTVEQNAWIQNGKVRWFVKHLDPMPPKMFMCLRQEKANFSALWRVLIDDNTKTCDEWMEAGGYAIPFSGDYGNALHEVKALRTAYVDTMRELKLPIPI
jgi:hypothetical protein